MMKVIKILLLFLFVLHLTACATTDYVTHYGIFTAENSAGEERQFRLYWQILRDQGWGKEKFRAMPVVLQTQCSKRDIYMYDASFGPGRRCKGGGEQGIQYCGSSRLDMDRHALEIEDNSVCMNITDRFGADDILSLTGDVLVTVSCRPKKTKRRNEDGYESIDYLLNSEIPYIVSTKEVKGDDIDLFIPSISSHSSICELSD